MSSLKDRVTEYLIQLKVKPVMRRLNQSLSFPISANSVKKVLVIMPRNLELLERASNFVQSLRKTYPNWRVELFDVDKLNKDDLNHLQLPRPRIVAKLKQADYQFVLDLNDYCDHLSGFIALMTEAPYRLRLQSQPSFYYNLVFHTQNNGDTLYYDSLLNYLRKLFVRQG